MATRLFKPAPTPTVAPPKSHEEWSRLMRQVIARAEQTQHRSLPGLRAALVSGSTEKYLRSMGIIHPTDIDREFPL